MAKLYIGRMSAWAPGLETGEDWSLWAEGRREILMGNESPSLKHLPPLARRRLSQLTKMVLHVGHELNGKEGQYPTIFCSQLGEITQQNGISRTLLDSGEVRPSAFSLSVFNTPVSLLSIHEKNLEAATVQLSGEKGLISGLVSTIAELENDRSKEVILIFADESVPEDYRDLTEGNFLPYSYGLRVGTQGSEGDICLEICLDENKSGTVSGNVHPLSFFRWLLSGRSSAFEICDCGVRIEISDSGIG